MKATARKSANSSNIFKKVSFWAGGLIAILGFAMWMTLMASSTPEKKLDITPHALSTSGKPVIVLLYDSLMTEPLLEAIRQNKAPAFNYLIKQGTLYPNVVSSYPTMSVSIDSTMLTGSYPNEHHVPGLLWFDERNQKMISYGSGPSEVMNNGIQSVLRNSVIHLNQHHLSSKVETIYERLAQQHIPAASINGMIYRGMTPHKLSVPAPFTALNLLPQKLVVHGPDILSLGALSQYNKENDDNNYAWDRLGMNNIFAVKELEYLLENKALPPFTLAYLPDADDMLHSSGPYNISAIERADESLRNILNLFGSWENATKEAIWVVLGDSGQTQVGHEKDQALIDMDALLSSYKLWSPDREGGQLALALNERMGYIHILDDGISYAELSGQLMKEHRLQFIAWKDGNQHIVASHDHKNTLTFSKVGNYIDPYGQSWKLAGDLSILELTVDSEQQIQFGNYPDALSRLYGALHAQEGKIVIVDVKPSYELHDATSYNHLGGGSHGSMHKTDSIVPLIAVGADIPLTDQRIVALKQWLLTLISKEQKHNLAPLDNAKPKLQ